MREAAADAPGRVNVIGEHTDYHEGFVLPCATPQRTHVVLTRTGGRHVRLRSANVAGTVEFELGGEARGRGWADYIQGLTQALSRRGAALDGFELRVSSDVPVGSGLSSSAALEVAALRAMRLAFELELDDVEIARLAQRAEVDFVGAPVGLMDQMASSLGDPDHVLFLDTRTLGFERIALPKALGLVVIDSGVAHQHAGGGYASRRAESEAAARALGVSCLRDIGLDALSRINALPDLLARRARHIVSENARVLSACEALRRGDLGALGTLMIASHASLRDDYEVSIPEVDALVSIANRRPEVYGARMTGGGFGGAVVIAARADARREVADQVSREYQDVTGRHGSVLLP